ncbi:hypothetical protein [Neobacillus sp. LXY-1]|uniref:hypothetical protein n=1 Tax=Neobacillus sp. LXY-1 TaxID=3379133 RepID=UPI003EE0C082
MSLNSASYLTLEPHEIRPDRKNYIVEDKVSGEFYEMPKVCIDAINLINLGKSLNEVERQLKNNYPNEEIDILEFAVQLLEFGMIKEIDGVKVIKSNINEDSKGFGWVPIYLGKFFFNKLSYIVYFALLIMNIIIFLSHPSLIPNYKDIFVFDVMVFNILLWQGVTFILVLFHEFGHILAVRAQNQLTKLGIGHRLFFIVFETDLSSSWKVSPNGRNALFLSGLSFDMITLFFSLISKLFFFHGSIILQGIFNVIILDIVIRIIYQCCIYMKTDLYYVFENVTGCYNLMENAQMMLRKRMPFQKHIESDEVVFVGEKRTIAIYAIFYVIGIILTFLLLFYFYIPQLWYAINTFLPGFSKGPNSLPFWDATVFTLQLVMGLFLLGYSWKKKYFQK